ncbi:PEP-CTERM protein-sorting domain-containing protein [Microcystis aeruginosa]
MMTTNKLTKTFASGSLAIGVLAGAVLTATSASAAMLSWADWTNGTPLIQGDKKVTFVSQNNFGAEPPDEVSLIQMGDDYYFEYDAGPSSNTNSGFFTYTIEVTDPNRAITGVGLGSTVIPGYGSVTETFAEIPNTLVSVNGSSVPATGFIPIAPKTLLTVTNTLNPSSGQALTDFQNSFHQAEIPPVPEPGTVLGLLTVGGLGLVSRFKKQK